MQSLREAYGCSMILHPVRHLELSTYKGTKNVRETSDITRGLERVRQQKKEHIDGTDCEQDITKDNYKQYFHNVKWIDFTMPGE